MKSILPSLFLILLLIFSMIEIGNAAPRKQLRDPHLQKIKRDMQLIQTKFYDKNNSKQFIGELKKDIMDLGGRSVPILTRVMKDKKVSDQKRWMATFSLARIMGKKSSDYLAKFTKHPNWMLRLASLKSLLSLQDKSKGAFYKEALKDKSLLVRTQALENIRSLKMNEFGADVWQMMFHKHNYIGEKGKRKRMPIIAKVVRATGELKHEDAKMPMAKLIQSEKYRDLARDLDYSLSKLTGKKSPSNMSKKLAFWKKIN